MSEISIIVKNKIAYPASAEAFIVRDNSDYVINFSFDSEWDAYGAKTARFAFGSGYIDVPFTGNCVSVPVMSEGRMVKIGVFAGDISTTTPAILPLVRSIRSSGGVPVEPESSVYDKIMDMLGKLGGKTPATADTLGMIKVGENLSITSDGTLSADASGGAMSDDDILECLIAADMLAAVTSGGAILADENNQIILM